MTDRLLETGRNCGMEVNVKSSKVIGISGKEERLQIVLGNLALENVDHFETPDKSGQSDQGNQITNCIAKTSFSENRLLTSNLILDLRKKHKQLYLDCCCIWIGSMATKKNKGGLS